MFPASSSSLPNVGNPSLVRIKCVYNEDIRIITINPKTDTFESFRSVLSKEFGEDNIVKYKDADGDLVTIRNMDDLHAAISLFSDGNLRLFIFPVASSSLSSSSSIFSSFSGLVDSTASEDLTLRHFLDKLGVSEPFLTTTTRIFTKEGVTVLQLRNGEVSEEKMEQLQIGMGVRLLLRKLTLSVDSEDVRMLDCFLFD
jgi:hypothetical protein